MSQQSAPAQHYDHVTSAWRHLLGDDMHYGYFLEAGDDLQQATTNLTARMAKAAQVKPGHRVLDVGCGIGAPAIWLASRLGCFFTGISTSQVGIQIARHQASEQGVERCLQFLLCDGMCNGLRTGSFDCVWVMESSHLMSDKAALLAEAARVLRDGGRLALCDVILSRPVELSDLLTHHREFLLLERVFGEAKMETLDTYTELAENAGLTIDSIEDISEATLPTFARWRSNAYEQRDAVIDLIGRDGFEEFVASCDVLERFWQQRSLGYGLLTAVKAAA
jgi:27-O-demethylrifamycin SV methyltransferase